MFMSHHCNHIIISTTSGRVTGRKRANSQVKIFFGAKNAFFPVQWLPGSPNRVFVSAVAGLHLRKLLKQVHRIVASSVSISKC